MYIYRVLNISKESERNASVYPDEIVFVFWAIIMYFDIFTNIFLGDFRHFTYTIILMFVKKLYFFILYFAIFANKHLVFCYIR